MRFFTRVAGSVVAITLFVAVVVAGFIGLGGGLLLLVPVGAAVVIAFQLRRSRTMELGWSGSGSSVVTPVPPQSAPSLTTPQPSRRGRGGVAGSLARIEARELVASPWLHVGVAFWVVILATFGIMFADDVEHGWLEFFAIALFGCHPFAAFVIVAAHRNRSRSRRDGCDELFDACPADADARTLGHLATAWVAALVQVFFVLTLAILVVTRNDNFFGPLGAYSVAAVLVCALLGAGAVALGVTLGRWAPWGLVPFIAVAAVAFAGGMLNGIGDPAFATDRLLATFVATTGIDPMLLPSLWWERLAWFTAISVVVAAIGLLGGRSSRVAAAVLGAAALVAIVAAVLIVRPATEADRLADLVADPVTHSTCRPAGPHVEVCAYRGYEDLIDSAVAAVTPVAAAIPDGVMDDVVLLTFYAEGYERLPAEVQDSLGGRSVRLPDGTLRLRTTSHPEAFEAARFRLAARAVGLPTEAVGQPTTMVDGQSRGVIALWLATRGLDPTQRERILIADGSEEGSTATDRGEIWPGICHDENSVLQWSPTDLDAVRSLSARPDERVRQVLTERWEDLTAIDATTDQLLEAVGAESLGPTEPIEAQTANCG